MVLSISFLISSRLRRISIAVVIFELIMKQRRIWSEGAILETIFLNFVLILTLLNRLKLS